LMHEASGVFAEESVPGQNLGFWYTLAVFRHDSGARLVVVSSRGTQGYAEILADVGLYSDLVMRKTSMGTQVALWGAKQFLKASRAMQEQIGDAIAEQLEQDRLPRELDDIDAMSKQARNALLQGAATLAKTLHSWGHGELAFGTKLGSTRSRFLFCGHSIGGLSAGAVALKLKSLAEGSGQVAVVSTNSPGLRPFLSELGISGHAISSGWVNLVMQHDVIWKIGGDLVKQGQKICMYLHPAEESNCTTGDAELPRWEKLSDAVRSQCLSGLSVPGIAAMIGIKAGNGVMPDAWKCADFFTGCWPLEHNLGGIDLHAAMRKPLLKSDVSVHELLSKTGKTTFQDEGHGATSRAINAELVAAEMRAQQAFRLKVAQIRQNYSDESLSRDPQCRNDLSKDFCCDGDGLGLCSAQAGRQLESSFRCQSGQGEAFKAYASSARNTYEACAVQCLKDVGCKGFDFTTKNIKDACRLYGPNKERKEGDSGWEKRMYCFKQKMHGHQKTPRLPCSSGPQGSSCNGRCRCPVGQCLSVKKENAFGTTNYQQWECVRAREAEFFDKTQEEVALEEAQVAHAKTLRELRRQLWQKPLPAENWGWACTGP